MKNRKSNLSHSQIPAKQSVFFQMQQNSSYGGSLRCKKAGRCQRPLSSKDPLHVVFKINKSSLYSRSLRTHRNYAIVQKIIQKYAKKFFVHVEQISIQRDHIHLLIRTRRRSFFHHFFRVVSGQIAQTFQKEGLIRSAAKVTDTPEAPDAPGKEGFQRVKKVSLWLHRPFSRIVKGFKAYQIIRNYIQLNEKEALGEIKYQSQRLRGLSTADWQVLWS